MAGAGVSYALVCTNLNPQASLSIAPASGLVTFMSSTHDRESDGGSAFPLPEVNYQCWEGMSLHDYFAAKAMAAIIAAYNGPELELPDHDYVAKEAYMYADAMLKARGK